MTKMLVARELNMYFRKLRLEDSWLDMEDIGNYPEAQLTKICFQRGINITQSRPEQLRDLKLWLEISNKRNVPHSLLLWVVLNDFHQREEAAAVGAEVPAAVGAAAAAEAQKREQASEESSYLESVQAFEKAFGLDRLEKIIAETRHKRGVSISIKEL